MHISRKRALRILAVQSQMHEMAEWRLAAIQRQKLAVEAEKKSVVDTLNDERFRPLLVELVARKLKMLAQEDQRLATEEAFQKRKVREQGMRMKRAERLADRAGDAEQRVKERTALDEVLEAFISAGKASLPPA